MWNISVNKASEQIMLSRGQKNAYESTWDAFEKYYNGTVYQSREWDPRYLVSPNRTSRAFDNTIPDLITAQIAWVMSRPFEVQMNPLGDKGDIGRIMATKAVEEYVHYWKSQADFSHLLREIVLRMDCFNFCAVLDYWDEAKGMPGCRVFTHNDTFIDPLAMNQVNMDGGPRWIGLARLLHKDEARNRYGDKAIDLVAGRIITKDPDEANADPYASYSDLYEIIEWFGIDEEEIEITSEETEKIVNAELDALFADQPVEIDPYLNHLKAVEFGDQYVMRLTKDMSGEEQEDIEGAVQTLSMMGRADIIEDFMAWREAHAELYDEESPGGTRPKYPGGVYHCEFQFGGSGFLKEPEALEYPHYEIPVSIFRGRMNTTPGLFGNAGNAQVLALQCDVEKWEQTEYTFARAQARKNIAINRDALDPAWVKEIGLAGVLQRIQRGFETIYTSGSARASDAVHAIDVGNFSIDVRRLIDYKRFRMQEIIGPTPWMRGDVGNEASGKQVAIRQESGAVPMNDILNMIESPIQATFQRIATNVLAAATLEKVAEISGEQAAEAVDYIRQTLPDYACAASVNLGNAFPNDKQFLINFGLMLVQSGMLDAEVWGEKINSPFPIHNPMMPGAAPGGTPPPNTGSPPAPQQIQGMV